MLLVSNPSLSASKFAHPPVFGSAKSLGKQRLFVSLLFAWYGLDLSAGSF
jgi:hypothetical protein